MGSILKGKKQTKKEALSLQNYYELSAANFIILTALTNVLARCINSTMKAVNVPLFIGFGDCTNIMACSQFAIQRWKPELSVNEFCNTASWFVFAKGPPGHGEKTQQYNNGADGACLRRDINCSFLQGEKLPLSLYFKSPLSCRPKSLRVTILDHFIFFPPIITKHTLLPIEVDYSEQSLVTWRHATACETFSWSQFNVHRDVTLEA